ncbi:unnamed protein product [Cylicocyclus nassatus]|uniref:Ribophorin I n=1 Tax=Cylicocyclus nassatus TaxID=53992 RepID=A0AA36HB56_CYLNA|nr:unnamed protein product [Cylicocyclus nassatus]
MQAALLVVLIGVWIVSAWYDPVFVIQLARISKNRSDKDLLHALENNAILKRTTKEAVVNDILKEQDEKTQKAYAAIVQKTKQSRKAAYDKVLSKAGADQAVKNFFEQAEKINNDMNISDGDADRKMKELRAKLNQEQRKLVTELQFYLR